MKTTQSLIQPLTLLCVTALVGCAGNRNAIQPNPNDAEVYYGALRMVIKELRMMIKEITAKP